MTLFVKKLLLYLLLVLNFCVIIYFWYQTSGSHLFSGISTAFISIGRLAGLLLVFCVLLQFCLMGRFRWIEDVFGLDNTSKIHHWNGYALIAFLISHPVFLIAGYSMNAKVSLFAQFFDFLLNYHDVSKAVIGAFLLLVVIVLSVFIIRKRLKYEVWYFVHSFTYLAIALAWGHQLKVGVDFSNKIFVYYWYALYVFVFGNLLLFRFLRPLYLFLRHRFQVSKITLEGENANSIYITGRDLDKLKTKPGQFLKLRFLSKKFWFESHPFSSSMIPGDKKMRVTIKNSGDFTSRIADVRLGTRVIVDGPFGNFTLERSKKKKLIFIAGGVGITPIRTLIEQALKEERKLILFYSSKNENNIILKNELDELSARYKFHIYYFVSEGSGKFEKGHVTFEKIEKIAKHVKEYDFYICGPVLMMEDLAKQLKKSGVAKNQIHYEKFSL